MACKSNEGVRVYAIAVDGELLRLQISLCNLHGDLFLLLAGEMMGRIISGKVDAP